MAPSSDRKVDSIFWAVLEMNSPNEQAQYLDRVCGSDADLRGRVQRLLDSHKEAATGFSEKPAPGLDHAVDLNKEFLDAGLAATFGPGDAALLGGAGNSVLKSLGTKLPNVPHVTLHDSNDERADVVKPRSSEIPRTPSDSRYQLLGEIARGGMGAIIKGRDVDLGRDLAIKVLLDAHCNKPEVVQRFVEEAQIGGQLQHPGIAPVYELGQFDDQRPFFTMKLVKGETFAALLSQRKQPSDDLPRFLGVFEQVCQTMAYSHSKGVIHRDLKPANIMVGAFGEVQVMDWGLSKVLKAGGIADEKKSLDKHRDASVIETRRSLGSDFPSEVGSDTQAGSVMGTPAYMPPEQALGESDRLDKRADVFGIGSILCEILSGKPPYVAKNASELMRMASRGKLDDCFLRLDDCGADRVLIDLTKATLAPEMDDRIRDAGEVSKAITEYLESVQQRLRQSEIATAQAQTRRKLSVAIAGLMLLFAAFGAVAAASFRNQSQVNKKLAEDATAAQKLANHKAEQARAAESEARSAEILASIEKLRAVEAEDRSLQEALRAGMIAAEAIHTEDPTVGWLMAIEAVESYYEAKGQLPTVSFAYETLLSITSKSGRNVSQRSSQVLDLTFSDDGQWFASTDGDTVRLCDIRVDNPFGSERQLELLALKITSITFSPDSRWLAGASESGSLLLWEMTSRGDSPAIVMPGHTGKVNSIAFSADSSQLVTASRDGAARIWDLKAKLPAPSLLVLDGPGDVPLTCATFGPDGRWVLTGDEIGAVLAWDLREFSPQPREYRVAEQTKGAGESIRHVIVPPDGKQFITHVGEVLYVWDVQNRTQPRHVLWGHYHKIHACDLSADGRWLVTGGEETTVRLWDLESDDPMSNYEELGAHNDAILSVEITRNLCVTGSEDGTARVWNKNVPSDPPITLRGHVGKVSAVAISSSGKQVATAGVDNTLRLWELDIAMLSSNGRKLAGRELTPLERKRYMLAPKKLEGFQPYPLESLESLFDDTTLNGWKVEGEGDWRVENATIIGQGGRLVYMDDTYADVEVSIECSINKGGNSGLHVRTQYSEDPESWKIGYEAQISNMYGQLTRTGGIFGISEYWQQLVEDDEWFALTFRASGDELIVFVNGMPTTRALLRDREFTSGHISLQSRPGTTVRFRNIRARKL